MTEKILVVDDEPHFELIIRKAFREPIQGGEYAFSFALNGKEALARLEEEPDTAVVLSDINMPEMNGLTLLHELENSYPLIRTIVISAYGDMNNIRAAMNAGAFDFLIKPISIDDLRKTLSKTLFHVRQIREFETARREKERERKELVRHLKRMDRLKDEFLTNISHELQTPLNGIIGIAESLADGAAGPLSKQISWNLSMLVSSGKRLSALVNDILDFSKLKNRDLKLSLKPLHLKPLVDIVLSLSRPLLGGKPLLLENQLPDGLPLVVADENRLQQILHNLIGNAIKFTDEGKVWVSSDENEGSLQITVSDTGIGIPKQEFQNIFNSFEQLDGSATRKYSGTGLGLAVTRKLLQLHGGAIRVDSEPGKGSHFTFTLPKADPRDTEKGPAMEEQPKHSIIAWEDSELRAGVSMPKPLKSGTSFRILVADDEPVNLQVLANQFSLRNYEVVPVSNGFEVLETVRREPDFDLILLDLMMPGLSGYEVCRKIRETHSLFDLPILILTAKNQPRDFLAGLEAGANDYLAKPFDKRELLARAKTLLTLKQAVKRAITQARRLEAERHNRKIAENLRKLMETLTSTLEMEEVLSRFLESLTEVVPFERAMVTLLKNEQLEPVLTRGFREDERFADQTFSAVDRELFEEISRDRLPRIIHRPDQDPSLREFTSGAEIQAWLVVPLFNQGMVNGLVLLERIEAAPYDNQEMQLAFAFAAQAAIAIENAKLFGQVQILATLDELTGINNRRNFFSMGKLEFQRARRHGHSLSSIMVDIDHFKKFNDAHGHAVGDEVLCTIARRISRTCRVTDILGRYGGEEFAILLPGTDQTKAGEVAERLRREVCEKPILVEKTGTGEPRPLRASISLGVSVVEESTPHLEDLLRQSDQALYAAKQGGRNRVVHFHELGDLEILAAKKTDM